MAKYQEWERIRQRQLNVWQGRGSTPDERVGTEDLGHDHRDADEGIARDGIPAFGGRIWNADKYRSRVRRVRRSRVGEQVIKPSDDDAIRRFKQQQHFRRRVDPRQPLRQSRLERWIDWVFRSDERS